jgi:hypothetical protein
MTKAMRDDSNRGRMIAATSFIILLVLAGSVGAQTTSSQSDSVADKLQHAEEVMSRLKLQKLRDINLARQAARDLNEILQIDPKTSFRTQIEFDLDWVNEILGVHELLVAAFYMGRPHALRAADARLTDITRNYPKFSKMDEVFFRLGIVALKDDRPKDAAGYFKTLVCNYSRSEYLESALRELNLMGVSASEGCDKLKP